VLLEVAKQINKTPAQVALNWVATQPGVTSTIIGATKLAQLENNLGAIEFAIPADLRKRLDDASALDPAHPYLFFDSSLQAMISGGTSVQSWAAARIYGKATVLEAKAKA